MTPSQFRLYRRAWADCLHSLIDLGRIPAADPAAADDARRQIHAEVGAPASSKDFNQRDLDRVLSQFWVWSQPANLQAQLRQLSQAELRIKARSDELLTQIDALLRATGEAGLPASTWRNYLQAMASRICKGRRVEDLHPQADWPKVLAALTYRVKQLRHRLDPDLEHSPRTRATRRAKRNQPKAAATRAPSIEVVFDENPF
jgi:hypothetical protein